MHQISALPHHHSANSPHTPACHAAAMLVATYLPQWQRDSLAYVSKYSHHHHAASLPKCVSAYLLERSA